jgi:HD-GYP domain-containing protein (c-di-GMP phosphodiesterase class II)
MARVLLLAPDRRRASDVRGILGHDGHHVTWLRNIVAWRDHERRLLPEIVVATVPSAAGVLAGAGEGSTRGFPAPLLFIQQESEIQPEPYLRGRLVDRVYSPFLAEDFLGRVDALVRVRRLIQRGPSRAGSGRTPFQELGHRISSWVRSCLPPRDLPAGPYLEVADRVAEWADRRDAFEPGHAGRVTALCTRMAEALDLGEDETAELLRAAMLHDIGKVALPVEVLHEPQPLDDNQLRLIRTHPARGAALLLALERNERVARVVLYHHERPDGAGYYGKRSGVPRASLVLAVAETYDAMTSSRLRDPLEPQAALARLADGRGAAYDGDCVDALTDHVRSRPTTLPLSSA